MIVDRGEDELARFSGGEQDLANLCLRLSIADWVSKERTVELGFVVLDEVLEAKTTSAANAYSPSSAFSAVASDRCSSLLIFQTSRSSATLRLRFRWLSRGGASQP
jgi:hypothetical protein